MSDLGGCGCKGDVVVWIGVCVVVLMIVCVCVWFRVDCGVWLVLRLKNLCWWILVGVVANG